VKNIEKVSFIHSYGLSTAVKKQFDQNRGAGMEQKTRKAKVVLILGLIGIMGVLLTIISDLILLGRPDSAYSFFKMGTESMVDIAQWRITLGTFLGVIVLPLQLLGLIPVYYGLKPSGKVMPLIMVITVAHALIMGVAFHISYAFIGSGWKFHITDAGNKIAAEMIKQFDFYWKALVIIMILEIVFSSVIYVLIVRKGNTLFPKWMAVLNPFCVVILTLFFIFILPAPVGGFVAPACLNISTMVFFGVTTARIGNKKLQKL